MSDLRSYGEDAVPGLPGTGASSGAGESEGAKKDALFEFGFQTTRNAIALMRTLTAAGMDGATKMGCTLAVVQEALRKAAPAIPVPAWLRLGQALVAKLVISLLGSVFAGVLEAIYQETIRKPAAEPAEK